MQLSIWLIYQLYPFPNIFLNTFSKLIGTRHIFHTKVFHMSTKKMSAQIHPSIRVSKRIKNGIIFVEVCIHLVKLARDLTRPGPPKGSFLEGKWDPRYFREI